jgi:hypothetical protein
MTGGTAGHSLIHGNIYVALRRRARSPCMAFGADAGVATVGDAA